MDALYPASSLMISQEQGDRREDHLHGLEGRAQSHSELTSESASRPAWLDLSGPRRAGSLHPASGVRRLGRSSPMKGTETRP